MGALTPTNDFVLLEPVKQAPYHTYKRYEHIVVPDKYDHGPEDRPRFGAILAKGPTCVREDLPVGTLVLVGKWDGAPVPYEGKTYLLVKEDSILAKVDGH